MKETYPKITLVNKTQNDGAGYFGPFGSRGVTNALLEAIRHTLKLPDCSKQFPKDIGKDRPCLNYHMNLCSGWCQKGKSEAEYIQTMEQAKQLLQGNYKQVAEGIKTQMIAAADELNFELAAGLRDRLKAVENLGQKQLVTAGTLADTDVIGFYTTDTKACFTVLHFSGGNLLDKDYEILPPEDDVQSAVSSLLKQYYLSKGYAPKFVLLPCEIEDGPVFEQLLEQQYGKKPHLKVPQRGDNMRLVELANKNAKEEVLRITDKAERSKSALKLLGKMLTMDAPERIESYDISNISGTDIVGSMVVFHDGRPKKSDYKRFKIKDLDGQDDYASKRQVLLRRFTHYMNGDEGFCEEPHLLLIDGGITHACTAVQVLQELGLSFPVFGMVKDGRHRTRALVTPDGKEINIDSQQSVFSLIGNIQEETHRFAITYHRDLRSKRLQYSELDSIPGIGPKRKEMLLKTFKSIAGIKRASLYELERILPKDAAGAVYQHFTEEKE
jgi:excinuclease ABC subunit C